MKNRFKIWLIHKLGGFVIKDFPGDIQVAIYEHWIERMKKASAKTIDKDICNILENGFKTHNVYEVVGSDKTWTKGEGTVASE